jgi:hypothetical protein
MLLEKECTRLKGHREVPVALLRRYLWSSDSQPITADPGRANHKRASVTTSTVCKANKSYVSPTIIFISLIAILF